jgi:hypothetical protein
MSRRPRRRSPALITAVLLLLPVSTALSDVLPDTEVERLVAEALERNPDLRAARDAAAAAGERVRPAGALPDDGLALVRERRVSPRSGRWT